MKKFSLDSTSNSWNALMNSSTEWDDEHETFYELM